MSSGDESIDIPDEIEVIEEVEGENDNPIETIETGEETAQNNEGKDSDDEDKKKVVKAKRIVRNPQPKLNEHTLRTKKGLTAVPNHFKRVKFKGRGHEAQDLNVLMKTYEYWCHRLYPKFPFDACIAKLETLGTKKGTQVLLKKIRLGMDICDDDKKIVSDEEQEGETPMTEGFVDTFDNRFDQLLSGTNGTARPAVEQLRPVELETTEEQLEKIRQNKLRAEALRRQRLEKIKANTQNQENPTTSSSSRNDSTIGETCIDDQAGFDNILSSVNKDPDTSVQKKTFHLNGGSSDEEEVTCQTSSNKSVQKKISHLNGSSSDEEEISPQKSSNKSVQKKTSHLNGSSSDEEEITSQKSSNKSVQKKISHLNDSSSDEEEITSSEKSSPKSVQKKTSHLNDDSSDEEIVFQKSSGPKRTRVISSDGEEMHVDSEKPTTDKSEKNDNSIKRKKIRTIESDDEMEINRGLDVCTQDETRTNAMEEDNEEVDLDNILSIVNEDSETPVSKKLDESGTILNKTSIDKEKHNSFDSVNDDISMNILRKKVQTIGSSDEMETNVNSTDSSADGIPKMSDEFDTNSTSAEDNPTEPFRETAEV